MTLYLFPTQAEAEPFRRLCPTAQVAIIGVGMAEAAARSSRAVVQRAPRRVVLCGVAGAVDESLQVGDVVEVVSDRVVGLPAAFSREYLCPPKTALPKACALTVSRTGDGVDALPITSTEPTASLPTIEQMEGAAVAAVAEAFGVEYVHLRAISNRVSDSREQWRIDDAIEALTQILKNIPL